MKNSTHLNIGFDKNTVAFLFSCPGQEEEKNNKPVSGKTGNNLDILLKYLIIQGKNYFPYKNRYNYRITNAWNKVEYKNKTNRTEATITEIMQEKNLTRIQSELKNMKILILFGKKAQKIINFINFNGIAIKSKHLSMQGIAHIKTDIHGTILKKRAKGNTEKRIEVIASDILKHITKQSSQYIT